MYSTILIATDLSRDSDELVRCAKGLHALGCRTAHLVYGLDVEEIGAVRTGLEQLVRAELDQQCSALRAAGIQASGHVALHPVSLEIERIAVQHACSLVIAGSRVHSLGGEIVAGGIAATVLTSTARLPRLMLRLNQTDAAAPPTCGSWPCAPLEHLLFPTDFSDRADPVFDYIERFAAEHSPARITLLHVQDRKRIEPYLTDRLEEFNAIDLGRLETLRQRLAGVTPSQVDIELACGNPSQEIIGFCRREAVSLVIMGTQGRGYVSEVFLGSVSHNMARHSPAPVLLIPDGRQ